MNDAGLASPTPDAFRWPPAEPTPSPSHSSEPAAGPRRSPRNRSWRLATAAIESFWLPPVAEPFEAVASALGWAPDPFDRYCDLCGSSIGPYESDEFGCAACRGRRLPWHKVVRLGEYEGALAEFVKDAKFNRRRTVARALGSRLGARVRLVADTAPAVGRRICVVPVPMPLTRRLARPFDHAAEIAAGVARTLDVPLVRALSARNRPSQRSVPASRRPANVQHSFGPLRGVDFHGWTPVLVDDVMTTGSTVIEACRVLAKQGAGSVWIAVVSVTLGPDRRPGVDDATPDRPAAPVPVEKMNRGLDTLGAAGTVPLPTHGKG